MMLELFQETVTPAQLVGWVGFITMASAYQFKTAKKIRFVAALAAVVFATHFYLLGAKAAMVIAIVASVRGFAFGFDVVLKRRKIAAIVALAAAYLGVFLSGAMTDWTVSIALLGTSLSCLQDLQTKAQIMRSVGLARASVWLVYNTLIGSHGGVMNNVTVLFSSLFGMWRHHRKREC